MPISKDNWGYAEEIGPSHWKKVFEIASGPRQSPIDIVTAEAKYGEPTSPLTFMYKPEEELELSNTGHSIQAKINQKSEICGGPLTYKYKLVQFHMHWGSKKEQGSEHTIDGKEFSAELHLVHYNSEKYKDFNEAVDKPDGLAVVGVMIKEGEESASLLPVTSNAGKVCTSKATFTVPESFDPINLLPGDRTAYWTYLGSLTTPPLLESVTWIVLREPVEVSCEQLDELRGMEDCHNLDMSNNYRPPCPLNGREVTKSFR